MSLNPFPGSLSKHCVRVPDDGDEDPGADDEVAEEDGDPLGDHHHAVEVAEEAGQQEAQIVGDQDVLDEVRIIAHEA